MIFIFFLVTIFLFFNEARNNYWAEWQDHKNWYKVQSFGIAVALSTNIVVNCFFIKSLKSNNYYLMLFIRNLAGFVFVLSKTPKDCFLCFSKLKNIKYSMWQYVEFIYTEQMLLIRRNAGLLAELQKIN
jgi:hypothetical protein